MLRNMQRGMSGEFLSSAEPLTPPISSRPSSQRKNGEEVFPNDLSPGILDIHSFDTELLPEVILSLVSAFPYCLTSATRNLIFVLECCLAG